MKFFIFISALFTIIGCANKVEEPNYIGLSPVYAVFEGQVFRVPPPRPRVHVPSPPSLSVVIPARPNFIPHMPEDSRNRLKILLTQRGK